MNILLWYQSGMDSGNISGALYCGGIPAASMCAIPQKYQSRFNAGTPLSGAHWPPWWDWLGYSPS